MFSLFRRARDPISSYTHAIGAVFSAIAAVFMVTYGLLSPTAATTSLIGAIVFGLSMMALYSASAIYHFANSTADRIRRLRKFDHAMIYVLIAGTYTPLSLTFMPQPHGFYFTGILWAVAGVGIVSKLFWVNSPRWLSTSFYLLMGWAIVFDFRAFSGIPAGCLGLIAAGGVLYSIGAFVYVLGRPNISKAWGSHEIFHLFILLGTMMHFLAVVLFVL